MDIRDYNRRMWNRQVERGNPWTVPVTPEAIAAARRGEWEVVLTPKRPVPRSWFPPLEGADVLGLASAGGQQGPIFAAAGAHVTVYDNSPNQLARDREVAERERLEIETVEGDMGDLGALEGASFDLVFHPCSNVFVPEVRPVWLEAFRVLRPGGVLLAGFGNPALFLFDQTKIDGGVLELRHQLPYSDIEDLTEQERGPWIETDEPLAWSHTLEAQIGGQLEAGFHLTGFLEDHDEGPLAEYMPTYLMTRAVRPSPG